MGFLAIASLVMTAASTAMAAQARAKEAAYQSKIAQMNQQTANQQAAFKEQSMENKTKEMGINARARVGKLAAAQAAGGVEGASTENVQGSEAALMNTAISDERTSDTQQWWGIKSQAAGYGAQASMYSSAAASSKAAGAVGAADALLSGASKGNEKYGWFNDINFSG